MATKKLSIAELESAVATAVSAANIANSSFSVTRNNIVGLVDKIGKIVTIDTVYSIDKLNRFDGEYLSYGKTIEEWQQDLTVPYDYSSTGVLANGADALSPYDPSYRPAFYSETIGRKFIPTTIRNNNIERAVHFAEQFNNIVAMITKRLQDSMAQYRYAVKRQLFAKLIALAEGESLYAGTLPSTFSASTSYTVNTLLKDGSTPTAVGIVVKAYTANDAANWAGAVSAGYIIPLNLLCDLSVPTDESTCTAFIEQVKKDVEIASDVSEGYSLNGNTLGATEGLALVVKQGIIPVTEVQSLAGAFHDQYLATPAEVVVVKDFGNADSKYFAVLLDARGLRLHNTYRATREQVNALGDWLTLFEHTEDTGFISRNTFVRVYGKLS